MPVCVHKDGAAATACCSHARCRQRVRSISADDQVGPRTNEPGLVLLVALRFSGRLCADMTSSKR